MGIHYIARKHLKVAGRTVAPGEIVPEAATWRNVNTYVDNGSLAVGLDVPAEAVENAELKARVAALEARVALLEGLVSGTGDVLGEVEAIAAQDGVPPDPAVGDELVPGHLDADELGKWTRDQLNAVAADLGIEQPDDKAAFPNKDALIAAIVAIPVKVPATDTSASGGA